MNVLAIDPGPLESGWAIMDDRLHVIASGVDPNDTVVVDCGLGYVSGKGSFEHIVIEKVVSYGMAVGESTFETVFWSGRFAQAASTGSIHTPVTRLPRSAVKSALCHDMKAKDTNIKQAIIDRYGGAEGKAKAVGTKAQPGPLYGVKTHAWSAVALGITFFEMQ